MEKSAWWNLWSLRVSLLKLPLSYCLFGDTSPSSLEQIGHRYTVCSLSFPLFLRRSEDTHVFIKLTFLHLFWLQHFIPYITENRKVMIWLICETMHYIVCWGCQGECNSLQKCVEAGEAQCVVVKQRNFVCLTGVLREGLHHESPRRWRQNWSSPRAHVWAGLCPETKSNLHQISHTFMMFHGHHLWLFLHWCLGFSHYDCTSYTSSLFVGLTSSLHARAA